MNYSDKSIPSWVKFGGEGHRADLCFVGKETVAVAAKGSYILFTSIKKGVIANDPVNFLIFEANGLHNNPDGIDCMSAHGIISVFAIAENKMKPYIYLLAYPSFAQITKFKTKASSGYQALAFSEGEIMVSLSRQPDFALTVWNWMTADELKTINTSITTFSQKIKCFSNSPILISQISEETNKLLVWEVSFCYSTCHAVSKLIDLPEAKYSCVCWTPDGKLSIINDKGGIYFIDPETSTVTLFFQQEKEFNLENLKPCIGFYKSYFIVTTPDGEAKNYRKAKGYWVESKQKYELRNPVIMFVPSQDWSTLVGFTTQGEILKICFTESNDDDTAFVNILLNTFGEAIFDISIINPEQNYFVTINRKESLQVWKIDDGELVSEFQIENRCTSITEHPLLPIVVLGRDDGAVHFIDLSIATFPRTLCFYMLDHNKITKVIFDKLGNVAVAGSLNIGAFFLLQAFPESEQFYQVTHYLELRLPVVSFSFGGTSSEPLLALLLYPPKINSNDEIKNEKNIPLKDKSEKSKSVFGSPDQNKVNDHENEGILQSPRQKLILYRIISNKNEENKELCGFIPYANLKLPLVSLKDETKQSVTTLSNYYSELAIGNGPFLKSTEFYAFPFHSHKIHILETDIKNLENPEEVQVTSILDTIHQIKCKGNTKKSVQIGTLNDNFLLTYGADGLTSLEQKNVSGKYEKLSIVMRIHLYINGGIRKALCTSTGSYVISLGWDGCLVGTKLQWKDPEVSSKLLREQMNLKGKSAEITFLQSNSSSNQITDPKLLKTYVELQSEEKIKVEILISAEEKQNIYAEFQAIRKELNDLIKKNKKAPKLERLPMSDFDLNKKLKEKRIKEEELYRKEEELRIQNLIKSYLDKVKDLKTLCWDTMEVKGKCIKALIGDLKIDNYPLLPESSDFEEKIGQVIERRTMEIQFTVNKIFTPWIPKSDSYIHRFLSQGLVSASQSKFSVHGDERTRLYMVMMASEDEADENDKSNEKIATTVYETEDVHFDWSGSISHKFVTIPECLHRQQLELYTFNSSYNENILLEFLIDKLRKYFNTQLEKTFEVKKVVMSKAAENIARLNEIQSEHQWCLDANPTDSLNQNRNSLTTDSIKESSSLKMPLVSVTTIFQPKWNPKEMPETKIMAVDDSEVNAIPYLTPEEEEALADKAREEERLRRLRAADNFRELALIEMMNGVLEVRWEDEIKKDVPRPGFMDKKKTEEWTENEIKLAKEYVENVKFLNSERDRYRKILEHEFEVRNDDHMRELFRFDNNLLDLHKVKMKVEACIIQENMKIINMQLRNDEMTSLRNKEQQILVELSCLKKKIEDINLEIQELQNVLQECGSIYESIAQRDRHLDQIFRKENEYSAAVSEQRYKIFKRRQKTHLRSTLSMALVTEVWKLHGLKAGSWKENVDDGNSQEKRKSSLLPAYVQILPSDAIDFLENLDSMDSYSNAFPGIDEESWVNLCKHRRAKIQNEIKMKITAQELVEANGALAQAQQCSKALTYKMEKLKQELDAIHKSKLNKCHDAQVQLILKNGRVEMECDGSLNDFSDAILIQQSVIDTMNNIIKGKGNVKLGAMKGFADFRRKVLVRQWEHKKMKMEIQDLEDELNTVETTKVTRDMLILLESLGCEDRTPQKFDKEIAFLKEDFAKRSKDIQEKMEELDKKITVKSKENKRLDNAVFSINIDVNEKILQCDPNFELKETKATNSRMAALIKRSQLINEIQEQYNNILVLQTELELLRLKTFPTFKYTTLT